LTCLVGGSILKTLRPGDIVFLRSGKPASVRRVELRFERMTVYNLTVCELHTFAIGDSEILVHNTPDCGLVAKIKGKLSLYPRVIDPRTGRHIGFPSGITGRVDKRLRFTWNGTTNRQAFIAEWHRRGYPAPRGGWGNYDIHHIQPLEFGGWNDFWNLVPVERGTHQDLFNIFWQEFLGL